MCKTGEFWWHALSNQPQQRCTLCVKSLHGLSARVSIQYKKKKANLKVPLALPNDHPFSNDRTSNECGEFKLAKNFSIGRDGRSFKSIAMQSKCKSCKETQKSKAFIKRRYGITYDEYLQRLEDPDNKCAIWRSSVHKNKRTGKLVQTLFIDHDYSTGKVRSLLCSPCNHALGQFKDNKAALFRAIKYLTQWRRKNLDLNWTQFIKRA